MEDIHQALVHTLVDEPDYESAPRGLKVRELIAASFTLTNPRNRLITSAARNVNYGFAVGELCWYIRGDTDLETMQYYNKRMSQFSDDGVSINSAYGARMFNGDCSQFDCVVAELKSDPDSRRAVMHINQPKDIEKIGSKDVPCTMSLQLLIRDRKLHMHVLMRSNDVIWGLPYDVFSFTCLQEAFLYKLQDAGVPVDDLGSYHHSAGSLHLYERHYEMASMVSKEVLHDLTPMKPFTLKEMYSLAEEDEPSVREDDWADVIHCPTSLPHVNSIIWMHEQIVNHKNKRIIEGRNQLCLPAPPETTSHSEP